MAYQPKLLFFAGSARKNSWNRKLARLAAQLARAGDAEVTLLELSDYPMPIYHGDIEDEQGIPETARKLKQLFRGSDGFFIASPEYNSSFSPLLKNTIDWLSRKESVDEPPLAVYRGKVAALASASPNQRGGLRGLVPLRMLLGNIGVHVIPQQLTVPAADKAFDDDGKLRDEQQGKTLESLVESLIRTSRLLAD